jgi:hypothetical protein
VLHGSYTRSSKIFDMIETKQAIKEKEDNLYTERNFCGTSNQSEVQNSVSKKKVQNSVSEI